MNDDALLKAFIVATGALVVATLALLERDNRAAERRRAEGPRWTDAARWER